MIDLNISYIYKKLFQKSSTRYEKFYSKRVEEKLFFNFLIDFNEYENKMELSNGIYAERVKEVKINQGSLNVTFQGSVRLKMENEGEEWDTPDSLEKNYPGGPYGSIERHGNICLILLNLLWKTYTLCLTNLLWLSIFILSHQTSSKILLFIDKPDFHLPDIIKMYCNLIKEMYSVLHRLITG